MILDVSFDSIVDAHSTLTCEEMKLWQIHLLNSRILQQWR